MLKQLSIFAENIKGKMQQVTGILLDEDINILGSVTNDSAEYGIVRMVVSKPEQALEALTKAGFICKLSDVLGIAVLPDFQSWCSMCRISARLRHA